MRDGAAHDRGGIIHQREILRQYFGSGNVARIPYFQRARDSCGPFPSPESRVWVTSLTVNFPASADTSAEVVDQMFPGPIMLGPG